MKPPPLLVTFEEDSIEEGRERFLRAMPQDFGLAHGAEIELLLERRLAPVVSIRGVAVLFGISPRLVASMYRRPERYYRTFSIPSGRKKREIQAPRVALKLIQRWLGFHLAKSIALGTEVCGFVPGQSAVRGASRHCGAHWVYSADIRNFFGSTTVKQVEDALMSLGYTRSGAEIAARLSSFHGVLAQGSPASPVLSNLAFRQADDELRRLALEVGASYSRYADDVVLSGKGIAPRDLPSRVRAIIEQYGWNLADEKERMATLPDRLKVYGLLVHGSLPRLTKGYRNRLRAFKHLSDVGKIREEDRARIQGHLSYSKSVDQFADKLTPE